MTKRVIGQIVLLVFPLFLSSCSVFGPGTSAKSGTGYISANLITNYTDALPVAGQLAIGTIKLEETQYKIDKAQAAELLILWKTLRVLNESTSASVEEINATIRQIEKTMKPEQIKAIAAMQLNSRDIAIGNGFDGSKDTPSPSVQATRQALRQSRSNGGGGPGGGFGGPPPGGFGGGMGGMMRGPQTTQAAGTKSTTMDTGLDANMINMVIGFLQTK